MRPSYSVAAVVLFVCLRSVAPASAAVRQGTTQTPPKPAPAQPAKPKPKPKKPRQPLFLTLGVSGQVTGNTFTQTLSYALYGETATVSGPTSLSHAPHFDVGFGGQLGKRLSLGTRMSIAKGTGSTDVTFSVPHPLIFNSNRTAEGSGPVHRSSLDVDIELSFALWIKKAWRVELMGGPTISHLSQQLATDTLKYVETGYPYDTITVQATGSSATHSNTTLGVEVGGRLAYQFTKRTGITFDVRWRHASFTTSVLGTDQQLISGGLQIGGGLKFVF